MNIIETRAVLNIVKLRNSKKLLCKTLNSRINIIETRAVLKTENFQVESNSGFLK